VLLRNHAYDLVLLAAEVEAPIAPLGEASRLTLPLGEEPLQRHLPGGKNTEVAVHREHVFVRRQRGGAADADRLLDCWKSACWVAFFVRYFL